MKRRNILKYFALFWTRFHSKSMGRDFSEKTSESVPLFFQISRKNQGKVSYINQAREEKIALEYGCLCVERDTFDYDENSFLEFTVQNDRGYAPIGILTGLNPAAACPIPQNSEKKLLDFFQFGFLVWNSDSQKLELAAVLNSRSKIFDPFGRLTHNTLSDYHCIQVLRPQNALYTFLLALTNLENTTLIFLGWNPNVKKWVLLYQDDPFDLKNHPNYHTAYDFFNHEEFKSHGNIFQIRCPGRGVGLFRSFFSDNFSFSLELIGDIPAGTYLSQNWRLNDPLADSQEEFMGTYIDETYGLLFLYFQNNQIRTLRWKAVDDSSFDFEVIHSESAPFLVGFKLFKINAENSPSQMLLCSHHSEGLSFFYSKTEDFFGQKVRVLKRQMLHDINNHPAVQNILRQKNDRETLPKNLIFSKVVSQKNQSSHSSETYYSLQILDPKSLKNQSISHPQVLIEFSISQKGAVKISEKNATHEDPPPTRVPIREILGKSVNPKNQFFFLNASGFSHFFKTEKQVQISFALLEHSNKKTNLSVNPPDPSPPSRSNAFGIVITPFYPRMNLSGPYFDCLPELVDANPLFIHIWQWLRDSQRIMHATSSLPHFLLYARGDLVVVNKNYDRDRKTFDFHLNYHNINTNFSQFIYEIQSQIRGMLVLHLLGEDTPPCLICDIMGAVFGFLAPPQFHDLAMHYAMQHFNSFVSPEPPPVIRNISYRVLDYTFADYLAREENSFPAKIALVDHIFENKNYDLRFICGSLYFPWELKWCGFLQDQEGSFQHFQKVRLKMALWRKEHVGEHSENWPFDPTGQDQSTSPWLKKIMPLDFTPETPEFVKFAFYLCWRAFMSIAEETQNYCLQLNTGCMYSGFPSLMGVFGPMIGVIPKRGQAPDITHINLRSDSTGMIPAAFFQKNGGIVHIPNRYTPTLGRSRVNLEEARTATDPRLQISNTSCSYLEIPKFNAKELREIFFI